MINVQNVSVFFGQQELFSDISFMVKPKDRIGLAGKNGAGKSTLLKLLVGEFKPDNGTISKPKETTLGYLPQYMKHNEEVSIIEETKSALAVIKELQNQIDEITHQLETRTDYETDSYMQLITDLNDANDRYTILGGDNADEKAERILAGLGFEQKEFNNPMSSFSGGWKMRVELAKILLLNPEVILLDEPTNHLDIESIFWLESFLDAYPGIVIVISHDKRFLDNVTTRTIEISNRKIYDYKANYSKYIVLREEQRIQQESTFKNQQKEIEHTKDLINKFRAKKNKAAFAQSLIKKLDRMDIVEVDLADNSAMKLQFPPAPSSGKVVLKADALGKAYGDKVVLNDTELIVAKGDKIALVGKNGVGKTTLLNLITKEADYTGELELGHNVKIGYYAQNQTDLLDQEKTVFETIDDVAVGDMRKRVRNILGSFLFSGEDADKKVKVLSGGEKARLALCQLLLEPVNFLILDEPTNHLDIKSKEVLKQALKDYDGTFMVVSHDRDFLDDLTNLIYEIKEKRVAIHHYGINDFLTAKQQELVDTATKKKEQVKKKESDNKMSYEQKKANEKAVRKLTNKISNSEKKIAELEEKIEAINEEVAALDYSDKAKTEEVLGKHQKAKEELEKVYAEWENATMELDELG